MNPIQACEKQILDIIGALYVLGAESEANLLETDLYFAGCELDELTEVKCTGLKELRRIRDFAEQALCAYSDQA